MNINSVTTSCPLNSLPQEIVEDILCRLDVKSLLEYTKTCTDAQGDAQKFLCPSRLTKAALKREKDLTSCVFMKTQALLWDNVLEGKGDFSSAKTEALLIDNVCHQSMALYQIVEQQAKCNSDGAKQTANLISRSDMKFKALLKIAVEKGDGDFSDVKSALLSEKVESSLANFPAEVKASFIADIEKQIAVEEEKFNAKKEEKKSEALIEQNVSDSDLLKELKKIESIPADPEKMDKLIAIAKKIPQSKMNK